MGFRKKDVEELLVKTGRLCCICHSRHNVSVHHIVPGIDDIDNGIPLCPSCHDAVHGSKASGRTSRAYTPEELKLFREETIKMVAEGRLPRVEAAPVPRAAKVLFVEPKLPDHFVARSKEFDALVKAVLGSGGGKSVAITTALAGAGGFGKTTLAAKLCHDERVKEHFFDGILWVTLGQTPDLLACLTTLYAEITDERPGFASVEDSANSLARALDGLKCLIVIDDVWNEGHLRDFPSGAGDCVRLITTRNQGIAGDDPVQVDEMTGDESIEMLTAGLPTLPHDMKPFQELAALLGEWPLLLELANAALRKRLRHRDSVDSALEYVRAAYVRHGFTAFDRKSESDRNAAAEKSLAATLDLLKKPERVRLAELSIFPEDIHVPVSAVAAMWGVDAPDAEKQLEEFADLSVLKLDLGSGSFRMHDVLRTALQEQLKDPAEPHKRIIRSWGDPRKLTHDYAWRWYAYHLVGAGKREELRALLFDFSWLQAKLDATDPAALIADYDHLPGDRETGLVQGAIRLSSHVLTQDRNQLAGQLLGRLLPQKEASIRSLLDAAAGWTGRPWFRPLTCSLTPSGGPLIRTLVGHERGIHAAAITPDGKWAVSGSYDKTLKLWDLETGREIRALEGHSGWVNAVAVTPDGKRAVSGSEDHTLKLWDLETGRETHTLEGHRRSVRCVAVTPDGKRAVSGSADNTLKLWDLETGREIRTLEGHMGRVRAVAITPDGKRAVSGSYYKTLRLWNLETGREIRAFKGHNDRVWCVAVTPDGKRAVSASSDKTLRLWDLETGREIRALEGHTGGVWPVAVTPDGRRAVSPSLSGTLKIWDLETGQLLADFYGDSAMTACAIAPDGKMIVAGEESGRVHFLRLEGLDT